MKPRATLLTVIFLVAFLLSASAQATAPSITTADLTKTISTEAINPTTGQLSRIEDMDIPLTGDFAILIVYNSENVLNELSKIFIFMREKGLPIIDYFDYDEARENGDINEDGEIKKKIALLLPEGFDLDTLIMNEFDTAQIFNYTGEIGDVLVTFEFPSEYREGQIIVAVIGIFDEMGNVEWIPLKVETVKGPNGVICVQIYFTQDAIIKAGEKSFALAILSE